MTHDEAAKALRFIRLSYDDSPRAAEALDLALAALSAKPEAVAMLTGRGDAPSPAQSGEDARDAARYRFLRERDLDAISAGGVFAGMTPKNVVLNGDDLDAAIDRALLARRERS